MRMVYKAYIFKISVFALQSARKLCIVMATNEKKDTAENGGILFSFCGFNYTYFSRTLQNKNAYLGVKCSKNNMDTLILHLILKKRKTL